MINLSLNEIIALREFPRLFENSDAARKTQLFIWNSLERGSPISDIIKNFNIGNSLIGNSKRMDLKTFTGKRCFVALSEAENPKRIFFGRRL